MDGMAQWLFLAYFVLMLATLIWKTPVISGPWLFLLRAFFPNWKFFHAVGYAPRLYARTVAQDPHGRRIWGQWTLLYPRRTRHWWHVFHNPDTNLGLAQQNLVHHLGADINALPEGGDPGSLVSYGMVCNLVAHAMRAQFPACSHFQFEVRMELDGPQRTVDAQTMLTSPVLPCP